jgi:hypothetical protein
LESRAIGVESALEEDHLTPLLRSTFSTFSSLEERYSTMEAKFTSLEEKVEQQAETIQ